MERVRISHLNFQFGIFNILGLYFEMLFLIQMKVKEKNKVVITSRITKILCLCYNMLTSLSLATKGDLNSIEHYLLYDLA